MQSADVGLDRRLFACFQAFLFDIVAHLCDELFDTPRMNTPVLDQLGKGAPCDFPPNRIKSADQHQPRRVVHNDIHAGGLLERANIAAFAAYDPTFHVVGGNLHARYDLLGGVLGCVSLNRGNDDFARALLRLVTSGRRHPFDQFRRFVFEFVLEGLQHGLCGFLLRHAGDFEKLLPTLGEKRTRFLFSCLDRLGLGFQLGAVLIEFTFLGGEGIQLSFEIVFSLGEAFIEGLELAAHFR